MTKLAQTSAPPIPEPDYSCTDSEGESDDEHKETSSLAVKLMSVQLQPVENSGNSNTRQVQQKWLFLLTFIVVYLRFLDK